MLGLYVFLNGDRGLSVLTALRYAGHEVRKVVIPPGNAMARPCREMGVEVLEVTNVNSADFVAVIRADAPELLVIAGFSTIIKGPVISAARLGAINLHAGRLPQYRGGSPLNWQIIQGERVAGLSIIQVDEGIDTGDILAEAELEIGPNEAIADLHLRANQIFPCLVMEVVAGLEAGTLVGRRQDPQQAGYWHQRNDRDGLLRPREMTADQALRMIRALTRPYPGAYLRVNNDIVRILAARLPKDFVLRGVPGRICRIQGGGPYVVFRDHAIELADWEIGGQACAPLQNGDCCE